MTVIHAKVELVRNLLLRALFGAETATRADVFLYIASLALDGHFEVADKALDIGHFGIGEDADLLVLRHIHHFRGQDARRAVQRRERLVELCHLTADGRLGFHDIHREARVRDIQSGLNARDTAADNKRPLGNGRFARRQRRVEVDFRDRRLGEDNRLFRSRCHILMHP